MSDVLFSLREEDLLDELEKAFPDDDISIIYVLVGAKKRKQSLLVNEEKLGFSWSPPINKIDTGYSYKALLEMCIKEIKNAKVKKK